MRSTSTGCLARTHSDKAAWLQRDLLSTAGRVAAPPALNSRGFSSSSVCDDEEVVPSLLANWGAVQCAHRIDRVCCYRVGARPRERRARDAPNARSWSPWRSARVHRLAARSLSSSCFLVDSACTSHCVLGPTRATYSSHDAFRRPPRPGLPHQTSACPRPSTPSRHEVARPRIPSNHSRSGADPARRTTRRPRQTPSRFPFLDVACRCDPDGNGRGDGHEESRAYGWRRSCAFEPAGISVRRPSLSSLSVTHGSRRQGMHSRLLLTSHRSHRTKIGTATTAEATQPLPTTFAAGATPPVKGAPPLPASASVRRLV